jgi:hypothetical protein
VQVSAGFTHSLALTAEGDVVAFGSSEHGELGGSGDTRGTLVVNPSLGAGERAVQLSAGFYTSAAVTAAGRVYTWGRNDRGQLGHPIDVDTSGSGGGGGGRKKVSCVEKPTVVRAFLSGSGGGGGGKVHQVETCVASTMFTTDVGLCTLNEVDP